MKLAKVNEKREVNIRKTVLAHLIVSQIAFIFVNFTKNKKNNNKIVNKSTLIEGIYDSFLYNFFTNKKFTKYYLVNFIKTYVRYINTNRGKSFAHVCIRANYRWYFKSQFKNVKSNNV